MNPFGVTVRLLPILFLSILTTVNSYSNIDSTPSLRDKIGQMLLVGFEGKHVDARSNIVKQIQKNNIGGVILFDYNYKTDSFDKNIESPKQVRALNKALQDYTTQGNTTHHRPQLPLLISIDYEGGQVTRLAEKYGFPPTLLASHVGQLTMPEAESVAQKMAETLKNEGFNLNFAPVLDVNVNPDNPIIGKKNRSFSERPLTVADYAFLFTNQYLNHNIQCVYKHFPGHGSSTGDSHLNFVDVSRTWKKDELKPYEQLLSKNNHCGVVMSAHIVNRQLDPSGLPATLSHKMLTDLLRKRLQFTGVIITDDLQMKAISDQYQLDEALVLAINAGADMLIFGNNLSVASQDPEQLIDIIDAKVKSGEISQQRIEEAYQHIVALKQSLRSKHLMDNYLPSKL